MKGIGELPATDFCEQKSMGASGGLFHAQPEGIAETKRIPAAGLLKGLLAVLQFTLLSPGYAFKIPNCPQSSGRSRYPSEDNGHSLSYLLDGYARFHPWTGSSSSGFLPVSGSGTSIRSIIIS